MPQFIGKLFSILMQLHSFLQAVSPKLKIINDHFLKNETIGILLDHFESCDAIIEAISVIYKASANTFKYFFKKEVSEVCSAVMSDNFKSIQKINFDNVFFLFN